LRKKNQQCKLKEFSMMQKRAVYRLQIRPCCVQINKLNRNKKKNLDKEVTWSQTRGGKQRYTSRWIRQAN
jgi:hypothetical protein